jgi:hypothetical protein
LRQVVPVRRQVLRLKRRDSAGRAFKVGALRWFLGPKFKPKKWSISSFLAKELADWRVRFKSAFFGKIVFI